MGRAHFHQLSRLRSVRASAQHSRRYRARDAQYIGRLRSQNDGLRSADTLHLMIEAKKLAFEDRSRSYGDPKFSRAPVETLLSKDYATKRRSLIDRQHAARHYDADTGKLAQGDTTYLCVADKDGNMISIIQRHGLRYRRPGPRLRISGPR